MYNTYYIYFLTSSNNSALYIGVTNDLERRIEEHRSGLIPGFTQKYNCHKLVYYEQYSDVNEAIAREKQLKKWSRSKNNGLVEKTNPEWKELYPKNE
ncbi:MAG: GIY-YIG nuclease family protein [Candidatus Cryptobacteroides sp.]